MSDLISFQINQDRRKNFFLFTDSLRNSGRYSEAIIDRLEAHVDEGRVENIVDSIFDNEPITVMQVMLRILFDFGFHSLD